MTIIPMSPNTPKLLVWILNDGEDSSVRRGQTPLLNNGKQNFH